MEVFAWVVLLIIALSHTHKEEVPAVLILEETAQVQDVITLEHLGVNSVFTVEYSDVEVPGVLLEDIDWGIDQHYIPVVNPSGCYVYEQHLWCPTQI